MKDARSWSAREAIPGSSGIWLKKSVALGLVSLLAVPLAEAAPKSIPQQQSAQPAQSVAAAPLRQQDAAPRGSEPAVSSSQLPDSPDSAQTIAQQDNGSSPTASQPEAQQQQTPALPMGTAVAPVEKPVGVPASRPAGAAIAPAKQRRTRVILISVGIVVGAAVALGTVYGLSNASPSRPAAVK